MSSIARQFEVLCTHSTLAPTVRDYSRDARRLRLHVAHGDARGIIADIAEADLQLDLLAQHNDVPLFGAHLLLHVPEVRTLVQGRPTQVRLTTPRGEVMLVCRGLRLSEGGEPGRDCAVCGNAERFAQLGEAAQSFVVRDGRLIADGELDWKPAPTVRCGRCDAPMRSSLRDGAFNNDLGKGVSLAL